jgi:photosystem II stability/assembly factor-like uncharacterized protein
MKKYLLAAVVTFTVFIIFQKLEKENTTYIPGSYKALDLFSYLRAYPNNEIPADAYYRGYEKHIKMMGRQENAKSISNKWQAMGPLNTAGRALTLAINPLDDETIYMGTASGGLWRSRNLGLEQSWEYVETGFPILGVSTVAFPEGDSSTIYIGTGEVYNFFSTGTDGAYRSTRGSYGIGILKSEDGGRNWQKSLDWTYQQNHGIWKIELSKLNPQNVWAATTQGLYQSLDGGNSWSQKLDVIMGTDINIDPRDDQRIVAAFGNFGTPGKGIYFTKNGGEDWQAVEADGWSDFQGKILIDRSRSNPDVLYASVGNGFGFNDGATWLLKSIDNGRNWSVVNDFDYSKWQGWFSHDIAVHPEDDKILMAVGIDVYKSTDGGDRLVQKTNGGVPLGRPSISGPDGPATYSHPDHHFVSFHPNHPDTVLLTNDGGLFLSFDGGDTYCSANGGLQTTQFYNGFSVSEADSIFALGGLQDNSTVIFRGNGAWQRAIGGDGSWSAINQSDNSVVFGSYQGLNILKSTNKGQSFFNAGINFAPSENPLFISPYVISNDDSPVIYAGGIYVYKSEDLAFNWETTNAGLPLNGDPVFCMDVSRTDSDVVYVATVPVVDVPRVFVTQDGGDSWTLTDNSFPDRIPNDIVIHPFDPAIAYLCFSGFGTDHLFRTLDYGESWEALGSGLPDVPCNALAIDPADPDILYLGNDLSVYVSTDAGFNWEVFNSDLPKAVISMDLKISSTDRKLWLATHGHGAYKSDLLSSTVSNENPVVESQQIRFYPNPASEVLFLENTAVENVPEWQLYNISGQLFRQGRSTVIQLNDIPPGQYLLRLMDKATAYIESKIVTIL